MNLEELLSNNLDNPEELERIYRENPEEFKLWLETAYTANPQSVILQVWNTRGRHWY